MPGRPAWVGLPSPREAGSSATRPPPAADWARAPSPCSPVATWPATTTASTVVTAAAAIPVNARPLPPCPWAFSWSAVRGGSPEPRVRSPSASHAVPAARGPSDRSFRARPGTPVRGVKRSPSSSPPASNASTYAWRGVADGSRRWRGSSGPESASCRAGPSPDSPQPPPGSRCSGCPPRTRGVPWAGVPNEGRGVPRAGVPSKGLGKPCAGVPSSKRGVPRAGVPSASRGKPWEGVASARGAVPRGRRSPGGRGPRAPRGAGARRAGSGSRPGDRSSSGTARVCGVSVLSARPRRLCRPTSRLSSPRRLPPRRSTCPGPRGVRGTPWPLPVDTPSWRRAPRPAG